MIHDPMIHNPTIHDSYINYPNKLTLYRDNSSYQRKEKYKCNMQRPVFLGKENKPNQRSCIFKKLSFFLSTFSDEKNVAELVADMRGYYSNRLQQLSFN